MSINLNNQSDYYCLYQIFEFLAQYNVSQPWTFRVKATDNYCLVKYLLLWHSPQQGWGNCCCRPWYFIAEVFLALTLARNVKCVKLSILMLFSFISSLVLSSCISPLIHFLHLHCASPLVYPVHDRPFNISAGQAALSQLGLATDISSVCSLKYYTDKILRIATAGQANWRAHTVLLHAALLASKSCQLRNGPS